MARIYTLNTFNTDEIQRRLVTEGRKALFIRKQLWKYDYFVTKLINRSWTRAHSIGNWHRLNTKRLEEVLGRVTVGGKQREVYLVIREDLVRWGVILQHTQFDTTESGQIKSTALYKIIDEHLVNGWTASSALCPANLDDKVQYQELTGVYKGILDALHHLTIDRDAAADYTTHIYKNRLDIRAKRTRIGWVKNRKMDSYTYHCWLSAIDAVADGKWNLVVDFQSTGRCFHAFSSLPTPLRRFATLDGLPLVELDIRNCQPMLLIALLKGFSDIHVDADELKDYKRLCEAGEFYDYVAKLIEDEGEQVDMEVFKVDFFAKIFFSTERKQWKWRKIFAARFPTLSEAISAIKEGDHTKLAVELQKAESNIIIKDALSKAYNSGIKLAFSLHDAVYTTEEHADECYNFILEAFARYNIKPAIRIKYRQA